jgi:hypothetical protein
MLVLSLFGLTMLEGLSANRAASGLFFRAMMAVVFVRGLEALLVQ